MLMQAFDQLLESPGHCSPPDSLKRVLQDKTDSAETTQSASSSQHNENAYPLKYAFFHFDSTVSKSSHKSTSASRQTCRSWLCCKTMNLHIVLAGSRHKGSCCNRCNLPVQGDAVDRWQQYGYISLLPDADIEHFSVT